jgi:sensor c-di-GMP phosphodiesterase-like protein
MTQRPRKNASGRTDEKSSSVMIPYWRILTFILVLSGGIAGYFFGCKAVFWESIFRLDRNSKLLVARNDATLEEASKVLTSLGNSGFTTCSDDDIGYLRDLVFRSISLKDAGRIKGDKIECSAASGRSTRSISTMSTGSAHANGGFTYYNLKYSAKSGQDRAALQLGNAFVVFDSGEPLDQVVDPFRFAVTVKSSNGMQVGRAPSHSSKSGNPPVTIDGSGRVGEMLYATRCSLLGINCVTMSVPADYVLQNGTVGISACVCVGALTGLLFGMLLSRTQARRRNLSSQLSRALDRDKLRVVYQPIVNLATEMCVGAEALARWTNADGEAVDPDVFVKIAEENTFVSKITRSVLRQILRDFATTLQNRPGFRISMNVAAADLSDPTFLPMLNESLKRANVKPESIVIEITERSAADGVVAMETIRNLRRMGHSIHIDDFGTGHSNLDKLLYLFADTIKIDKAFTRVIGSESLAVTILPQILSMAKSLQLGVVVEGVETRMQSDYFNPNEQKIYAQGWLYGRPASAEAIQGLIANNQPVISTFSEPVKEEPEREMAIPQFSSKPGGPHLVEKRIA